MNFLCVNNYCFKRVEQNTQKAKFIIYKYKNSDYNDTELFDVYNTFSVHKQNALDYCKRLEHDLDGKNGHITSHNCEFFSYGFEFVSPYDGTLQIAYITPTYDYVTDYID